MIDIPKRRQKRIRYLDEAVTLTDYTGEVRQMAVTGLGRERYPVLDKQLRDNSPRDDHELCPP